jgi:outer membrane protein TolC
MLMLFSFCASSLTPTGFVVADPHPLVPPLPVCKCYGVNPSASAACIGIPYIPVCETENMGTPAGEPWQLTIQEAVSIAMNNSEAVRNLGLVEAASRNDIVRSIITRYDPLEARSEAQAQWGIFDPLFTQSMTWDKQDIPPGTSFNGIGNRPPQLDQAEWDTSIEQLLPIGTRVRYDLVTDYLLNPAHPPGLLIDPQYFTYDQYSITQPLWRGFGTDITMAPIKIAAAQAEQTDWQFKQEILALVRSIETTYWSLYAQNQNLKAIDAVLPHFREVVRMQEQQAGTAVGIESQLGRARSDMFLYEQRRLDTLSKIAENQLVLRNLMGVPPSDCRNIVPLAIPTTTKPFETLQQAVDTAIGQRPDVLRQRLQVYVAQQERVLAQNLTRPQLDFQGYWRTNGLGNSLPSSFDSKATNDFGSWHMGVFFQVPLGRRQSVNGLRAAEYRISRERAMLEQTAHQASYEVADAYRRLHWVYQQLDVMQNRQAALDQWGQGARAQYENPPQGMTPVFALDRYLLNLRDATDASMSKNSLIADYNSALARLQEVKGVLLENRNVTIAGDTTKNMPPDLPKPQLSMPESVQPAPQIQPAPVQVQPAPQAQPAPQPQQQTPAPNNVLPKPEAQAPQSSNTPPAIAQPQALAAPAPGEEPQPLPPADVQQPKSAKIEPPAAVQPAPTTAATPKPITPPAQSGQAATPKPQPQRPAPINPQQIESAKPQAAEPPKWQTPPAVTMSRQLPQANLQPLPLSAPPLQLPDSIRQAPPAFKPVRERTIVPAPLDAPLVGSPIAVPQPLQSPPTMLQPAPLNSTGPSPSLVMPESVRPTPPREELEPAPMQSPGITASPIQPSQPQAVEQPMPNTVTIAPEPIQQPAYEPSLKNGLQMPSSLSSERAHTILARKPAAGSISQPSETLAQPVEVARREPAAGSQTTPALRLQIPGSVQPQATSPQLPAPGAPAAIESAPGDHFGLNGGPALQAPSSVAIQYPTSIVQPQPLAAGRQAAQPGKSATNGVTAKPAAGLQMPPSVAGGEPRVARAESAPALQTTPTNESAAAPAGPELRMPNSVETIWR